MLAVVDLAPAAVAEAVGPAAEERAALDERHAGPEPRELTRRGDPGEPAAADDRGRSRPAHGRREWRTSAPPATPSLCGVDSETRPPSTA